MTTRTALFSFACCGLLAAGPEPDEAGLRRRVEQVKQSDAKDWQKVPWVASLPEAIRLAGRESCPVFLFTHDGNIETGRC
jgi:hypothetical protein